MRRKVLAAVLSLCLAALQLTGCGNEVTENNDVSKAVQTTTSQTSSETQTESSASDTETTTTTSETTEETTTTQSESESETETTTTAETTTTTEKAVEASGSLETSSSSAAPATTTAAKTTTKSAATTAQTTKSAAATTTAATKATTKPSSPQTQATTKAPAASSSNVKFYQDRLYVAGDSIAYGFCAYGYIPYEHNIAKGSLAMRNYTTPGWYNEFDVGGRKVMCMDAVIAKQPKLLYVSMGMNDINITSAQTYASNYVGFLKKVRANVPNCIIVAANITPTLPRRSDFNVTRIQNCNAAMINAVKAMNDPNIILFDAYSVVSGGGTYMVSSYSAGDGIHLAGVTYQKILARLAVVLDQYGVKEKLGA